MGKGKVLWEKYCAFLDQRFDEQVKYNIQQKNDLFKVWATTAAARKLCGDSVDKFEDIPLTMYEDYPVLHEFGKMVEEISSKIPRGQNESRWNYYNRISRKVSPMLEGCLADEYAFCCKTSGTSGNSKWMAHGKQFQQVLMNNIMAFIVVSCSDSWGDTRLNNGDKMFGIGGPAPFIAGIIYQTAIDQGFPLVPPLEVFDNIDDMRKKIMVSLKYIEKNKGEPLGFAGGVASAFHMACRYFVERPTLYRDYYQSMKLGPAKLVLFFMWLFYRFFDNGYKKINEIMPVKGLATGGFDTEIYKEYLTHQFGIEPLNVYMTTESGATMIGLPDRRGDLIPLLNSSYLEFLDKNDQILPVNEIKSDTVYELVYTPFRSVILRYRSGDLFKVVDFQEDGMPIFRFESRKIDLLEIRNYFRLSEALAVKALVRAGLPPTDKWAFTKEVEPEEHLCLLMEREWEYSEQEASRRVFDALRKVDPFFNNYVNDFGIKDPWQVVEVEYLKKGAFMRYIMMKAKSGVEMGQIKPLKLIIPKNRNIADLLRKV